MLQLASFFHHVKENTNGVAIIKLKWFVPYGW